MYPRVHVSLVSMRPTPGTALGDATTAETLPMVKEILNRQSFDLKVLILWQVGTGRNWAEAK